MLRKIIAILLLLNHFCINSQELIFERPSNLLSLPSNECYNIIQDKQGYIWFSTDAGLCKYNGNKLKVFSKNEGLTEESCYGSAYDKHGNVFVITSENRLLKIADDKIYELPVSKSLSKELNQLQAYPTDIKILQDSVLIIATQMNSYCVNILKNSFRKIKLNTESYDTQFTINGSDYFYSKDFKLNFDTYPNVGNSRFTFSLKFKGSRDFIINIPRSLNPKSSFERIKCCQNTKGTIFISSGTAILKVDKSGVYEVYNLQEDIISMHIDKDDNVWLGFRNIGLIMYENGIINSNKKKFALSNLTVTGIIELNNGSIWCSTLEKGVFCCQNTKVNKIVNPSPLSSSPTFFKVCDSSLFFNSGVSTIRKTNGIEAKEYFLKLDNKTIVSDILPFNNSIFIVCTYGIFKTDSSFKKLSHISFKNFKLGYTGRQLASCNGRIFGINNTSLFEIQGLTIVQRVQKFKSKLKSVFSHSKDLFIATENGVYLIDQTNFDFKLIKPIESIREAQINEKGEIAVLSKKEGLWIITGTKSINHDFKEIPNLKINDFSLSNNDGIWLATNKGVIKVIYSDTLSYELFDAQLGLPDRNYKKIEFSNRVLFTATDEEIFQMTWPISNNLSNKNNLISGQFYVNNKAIDLNKLKDLDYDQNNIKIAVENLNYGNRPSANKLYFHLDGYSIDDNSTVDNEIILSSLPPGEYTLKIFTDLDPNAFDYQTLSYSIAIKNPFWLQWWFILLLTLIGAAILFFLVKRYIRRIREKDQKAADLNNLINSYQMAAIRAQMNPHFIFNCINSIQRYIITNDSKSAYGYLTKFSKLIRMVLNNSEEDLISLAQELQILELYVEMEQLRFEDSFTYKVSIEESIAAEDFLMPPMMLQPYIENSIWHGIMHLDKNINGKIHISITSEDNSLIVRIEDNGVGREASRKMVAKNHKSKALSLNEKRIQAINSINQSLKGSITFEDILIENNKVNGTIVTLIIPQPND